MCEWSLACCGCIVTTAADCRLSIGVRYSSTAWCTVAEFENVSFSKFATRSCLMQARLEGTDDSA